MAQLPLPDRGQPLDVTYIYTMANVINQLANSVAFSNNKNIVIDTGSIGKQQLKNTDFAAVAGFTVVTIPANVTTGQVIESKYSFGMTFKNPPIVFAIPFAKNNDNASTNATVVVSDTTTTDAAFKVVFGTAGNANIGLNVFAIGIPYTPDSEPGNQPIRPPDDVFIRNPFG